MSLFKQSFKEVLQSNIGKPLKLIRITSMAACVSYDITPVEIKDENADEAVIIYFKERGKRKIKGIKAKSYDTMVLAGWDLFFGTEFEAMGKKILTSCTLMSADINLINFSDVKDYQAVKDYLDVYQLNPEFRDWERIQVRIDTEETINGYKRLYEERLSNSNN